MQKNPAEKITNLGAYKNQKTMNYMYPYKNEEKKYSKNPSKSYRINYPASKPTEIGSKSTMPTNKINLPLRLFSAVKLLSIQSLKLAVELELLDMQVG